MRPGHLNHRINDCTGIGSIDRIAEQPVLSSYCKRSDCIFTQIVCKATASVFKIGFSYIPTISWHKSLPCSCGCSAVVFAGPATTKKPQELVFPSRDAAVFVFGDHSRYFLLMESSIANSRLQYWTPCTTG